MSLFPGQGLGLPPGFGGFQMPVHYAPQGGMGGYTGPGSRAAGGVMAGANVGMGGLLSRYSQAAGGVQPVQAQPQSQAQQQMNIQKQQRQPYSPPTSGTGMPIPPQGMMGAQVMPEVGQSFTSNAQETTPGGMWGRPMQMPQQQPYGGGFMPPWMQQRSPWGGGMMGGMNRRFGGGMSPFMGGMSPYGFGGGMSPFMGGYNPFGGFGFGRMY